jgi:hypothetical protein
MTGCEGMTESEGLIMTTPIPFTKEGEGGLIIVIARHKVPKQSKYDDLQKDPGRI